MISAYFNERGYFVEADKGKSKFVYDLPDVVANNASMLYMARWIVLNQMLDIISNMEEDADLVLYSDSRLIEELQGELKADNNFAKESLRFFIESDYKKYHTVSFRKCASSTINGKLSERVNPERH